MTIVFVSGGNGEEDAQSQGGYGGNGKTPTIIYYDATHKTNADRIRAMTDEELAMWIDSVVKEAAADLAFGSDKPTKTLLYYFRWLKQEATE